MIYTDIYFTLLLSLLVLLEQRVAPPTASFCEDGNFSFRFFPHFQVSQEGRRCEGKKVYSI